MEFGKVDYRCSEKRGTGGIIRKTLNLTLIGLEDKQLLERKGVRSLRLARIIRLTREAEEQGCLLSYEDLSALLLTSLATLKRDVSCLEKNGSVVSLKGRRRSRSNGNGPKMERYGLVGVGLGTE
jgi:hypothetical protein